MAKEKDHQTFEYQESDINQAIALVEKLNIADGMKSLVINCLKTCLSINALLNKNRTLKKLIGRFFGFKSEKKKNGQINSPQSDTKDKNKDKDKDKEKGHGRRRYQDLENATQVHHSHPTLKKGDPCPEDDCTGKVYPMNPGVYVRVTAGPPIQTMVHLAEKFRCNLCSKIFGFIPEGIEEKEKYDEKVLAQVVMSKCFYGVPFEREAALGGLSASVRSDLFREADELFMGVLEILVEELISDGIVSFDDTKIKIQPEKKGGKKSGWASCFISRKVVIYILNRSHAGICFQDLLKKRPEDLGKMAVLSDALPCYEGYKKGHIDAHCLIHARRRFVENEEEDSEFCQKIIELIGQIYFIEKEGRKMEDLERMELHKSKSGPIMEQFISEAEEAVKTGKFLPSSGLGTAVKYVAENSSKLNLFMSIPGLPLDTNHVERGIKSPIRIRKTAPIYKTEMGARRTGNLMSIIGTCRLNKIPPWDYLCWAIKRLRGGSPPQDNTPWAFKQSLEKAGESKVQHFARAGPLTGTPESEAQMATS